MIKIYLAAPFFKPEQITLVDRIEKLVEGLGFDLFSPRREGTLLDMSKEERAAKSRSMFESNVRGIAERDLVLAVIDDSDRGVIWEMGFAYGVGTPVVTFTDHDYGLNVMIRESVRSHLRGMTDLRIFLQMMRASGWSEEIVSKFSHKEPAAT